MNNKKRLVLIAVIAVLVTVMAFTLVACNGDEDLSEKTIVVYIGNVKYDVTTNQAYLHGVLKEMKANSVIASYEYGDSYMGPYVNSIGDLHPNASNYQYCSVWHSIDKFELKSVHNSNAPLNSEAKDEDGTKFTVTNCDGAVLYYSGVGVGDLPVKNGATYAILISESLPWD